MKTATLLIAITVFSGIALGMTSLYSDMQYSYAPTNSSSMTGINALNGTINDINDDMRSMQNHSIGFGTKGLTDATKYADGMLAFLDLAGILSNIPNIFSSLLMSSFGFYVPEWFITLIIVSVTIIVVLNVANMFIRTE